MQHLRLYKEFLDFPSLPELNKSAEKFLQNFELKVATFFMIQEAFFDQKGFDFDIKLTVLRYSIIALNSTDKLDCERD